MHISLTVFVEPVEDRPDFRGIAVISCAAMSLRRDFSFFADDPFGTGGSAVITMDGENFFEVPHPEDSDLERRLLSAPEEKQVVASLLIEGITRALACFHESRHADPGVISCHEEYLFEATGEQFVHILSACGTPILE